MEDTVISICTLTYNHEKFISKAIESALVQKCSYKIEMIISDDCSTDNTVEIIKEYAAKYPGIIKPIFNAKNLGPKKNNVQCLTACTGKYIAGLEGDDYWTDTYKLQKQIDFLESNPDFIVTGHNIKELTDGNYIIPEISVKDYTRLGLNNTGFSTPCYTCSLVWRNVINPWPDILYKSPIGDWIIISLLMARGDLMIMPDVMGVYRKHTGMWSSQSRLNQLNGIIQSIDLMLLYPEFDKFKQFKNHLALTKINYIKEAALLTKDDETPLYESELNTIKYFEDKIEELNSIFRNEQKLSEKVTLPVLIKALQKKILKRVKK